MNDPRPRGKQNSAYRSAPRFLSKPRALAMNAHVAVLAISSPSEAPRIDVARQHLESKGLRVTVADNIAHQHRGYLAGTDDERAQELNRYLNSPEFDAFFFTRGGYGAMRILDRIDYDAVRRNPRPIVGFSDLTAMHQALAIHANVASFHGPMLNLDFFEGLSPDIEQWCVNMSVGAAPKTDGFATHQVIVEWNT